MVKVKICGITRKQDAEIAVELGARNLGFIFYKKSPRHITPSRAKKIIKHLPKKVTPVAVFVNETEKNIRRITGECGIRMIQLHGEETPEFCRKLKGYKIIKAFRVNKSLNNDRIQQYKVYAYLFDTYRKNAHGGTGKTFKWDLLKWNKLKRKIILSGGLNSKNIKRAVNSIKPYLVDVNSGVESSPGKKSAKKLKDLFKAVRN